MKHDIFVVIIFLFWLNFKPFNKLYKYKFIMQNESFYIWFCCFRYVSDQQFEEHESFKLYTFIFIWKQVNNHSQIIFATDKFDHYFRIYRIIQNFIQGLEE